PLLFMRPPPAPAPPQHPLSPTWLLLTVTPLRASVPSLRIPPPLTALLLLIVPRLTVSVPVLAMPPPSCVPPPVTPLSVSVSVPALAITPPGSPFVPPFLNVRPLTVAATPLLTVRARKCTILNGCP